jgi:hypothetical protein
MGKSPVEGHHVTAPHIGSDDATLVSKWVLSRPGGTSVR